MWFRRAAEQGFPNGQFNLGQLYFHGRGMAQSDDEGVKWFRLAAQQGNPGALFGLGRCLPLAVLGASRDPPRGAVPLQARRGRGARRRYRGRRTARGGIRIGVWTDVTISDPSIGPPGAKRSASHRRSARVLQSPRGGGGTGVHLRRAASTATP
mmetsp:Transcript_22163/g.76136  ORF Transcript_22163/g.76136 Transcript_22163/m.76136 type:complete len:154 (+) Transcript_22163:65-526(+)